MSSVSKPMPRPNNASKAEDRVPCSAREQTLHAHAANAPTASQTQAVSSCDEVISSPDKVRRSLSSLYYSTVKGILQQTYRVQYYRSYLDYARLSPERKVKLTTVTIYHLQCGKHWVASTRDLFIFHHTHTALSIKLSAPYIKSIQHIKYKLRPAPTSPLFTLNCGPIVYTYVSFFNLYY